MNARKPRRVLALLPLFGLAFVGAMACGSDKPPGPTPVPTPPPTPAASISATGAGTLVLHPSLDRRFAIAMETPIRITESGGGSADWGFARLQIYNRGVEVERTELTANDLRAAGTGRIAANANQVYRVIFRLNSDEFDRVDITLGFSDVRDARQFTAAVPFGSFTGVDLNFTPLSREYSKEPL